MRILITGSNGQLGTEIQKILKSGKSEIGAINIKYSISEIIAVDIEDLDITNLSAVKDKILNEYKPNIIFNCAAYTNVDKSEDDMDTSYKVNSIGPRNLAIVAKELGAEFIHVSTDYVFPGTINNNNRPYAEWDIPNPQSVYGKSKLLGEQMAIAEYNKTYVVRTSWLYGYNGKNFVKTILKIAKDKGQVSVVADQVGNPTSANDLAHHLVRLPFSGSIGIYHGTNNEICSWYDFAKYFIELSGIDAKVLPTTSDKFPSKVKRPSFSALDNMALRNTIGDDMRSWKDAIKNYMTSYNKETGEII